MFNKVLCVAVINNLKYKGNFNLMINDIYFQTASIAEWRNKSFICYLCEFAISISFFWLLFLSY